MTTGIPIRRSISAGHRATPEWGIMAAMIPSSGRGSLSRGTLLLADISGYTGFLNGVATAHRALIIDAEEPPAAYAVLSRILDAMLAAIEPTFRLAKLEGDAIFAVADGPPPQGSTVLDRIHGCYDAFREQLGLAGSQWTCRCDSCVRIHDLDLKFVLHHGDYVVHRIANQEELAGPDVIVAHRLLKNHARDLVGNRPYALLSDATLEALGIPAEGMVAGEESYDDLPPLKVHVLALD
jgi:Protein of unknown function (DUF2652)